MSSAVGPEVSTASHWGPQGQPRLRDHFPHGRYSPGREGRPARGAGADQEVLGHTPGHVLSDPGQGLGGHMGRTCKALKQAIGRSLSLQESRLQAPMPLGRCEMGQVATPPSPSSSKDWTKGGHVTHPWPMRTKQKLLGRASRKVCSKSNLSWYSPSCFPPAWDTDAISMSTSDDTQRG